MRTLHALLLLSAACGRMGFEAQNSDTDAQDILPQYDLLDLCPNAQDLDLDLDTIPDACDPCLASDDLGCAQPHGVGATAQPSWQERALLLAVNAIRADPQGFRDAHMTFTDTTAAAVFQTNPPALPPLSLKALAQEGAHFHAQDAVQCIDTIPDDTLCNGVPWDTWKTPYNPLATTAIYPHPWLSKGPEEAFYIAGAFACGWANSSATSRSYRNCVDDNDPARRRLFFSNSHQSVGSGYGSTSTDSFWELVFSDVAPSYAFPIVTGGNFFWEQSITFGFNLETQQPIQQAYVILDGVRESMSLQLGTASRGFYRYVTTPASTCRSYYFVVVDADGGLWRYPTDGAMRSGGEGDCNEVWSP